MTEIYNDHIKPVMEVEYYEMFLESIEVIM